jgi:hypothetical protein
VTRTICLVEGRLDINKGSELLRNATSDRSQLVGTWRMLTWQREFTDTGERIDALGTDPVGFVSYGAGRRVHAFVVKRDRPTPASLPPSNYEKIELFDSMLAYAGNRPRRSWASSMRPMKSARIRPH